MDKAETEGRHEAEDAPLREIEKSLHVAGNDAQNFEPRSLAENHNATLDEQQDGLDVSGPIANEINEQRKLS